MSLTALSCAAEVPADVEVGARVENVVLGTVEPDAQFPWIVRTSGNLTCHGVLIEPRWVLTAAHCIDPIVGGVTVSYRRTNPVTGEVTSGERVVNPSNVFVHPEYSFSALQNDIGLIRLPAPLDSDLDPDPLLQAADLPAGDIAGELGLVASTVHHNGELQPGAVAVLRANATVSAFKLYAKSTEGSLCQGDSGSGYVAKRNGRNTVIGIASASANNTCESRANFEFEATKVSAYGDWIRSHIGAQTQYRHFLRTNFGAPAAVGTPSAVVFPALGVTNVIFRDGSSQLHELWQQGSDSGWSNLTRLAGAASAASDATSYIAPDGFEVALFRADNGHVHSLYWNTGAVSTERLSEAAGAPRAAGKPVGYVGADGWTHVIYRTDNDGLEELYWIGQGAPGAGSLTNAARAPAAAGDPAPYVDTASGYNIVAYRGNDGHIHTLYWLTGEVGHDNLSAAAGSPEAAGDPIAYFRANDGSHQVTYRGVDGHLYELWWVGANAVQAINLTASAGAPTADSDPAGYYSAGTNTKHVFYRTSDGHIHEIWWYPGAGYTHVDLTAEAPAGLAVDKPAAFTVEGPNTQHVVFRGADNTIHEIRW